AVSASARRPSRSSAKRSWVCARVMLEKRKLKGAGRMRRRLGLAAAIALEREEDIAEFLECAVGADFGGAGGAFEDRGDFGEGELLEAAEEKDLAGVAIEAAEGHVKERVFVARHGVIAGVGTVV